MEIKALKEALRRSGRKVSDESGISPDGYVLICVDGTLMKYEHAEKLLYAKNHSQERPPR
ncbi:MAG TPA: hypothetical protein VJN43_23175 [Bryobacteraceae bacterium]|nr:hypothetical protein [Bryobacteraceae bacterium]